ncbi:hypothetical protein [Corynebacterium mendelii]
MAAAARGTRCRHHGAGVCGLDFHYFRRLSAAGANPLENHESD